MSEKRTMTGLVLAGGGARGAYQAGALTAIAEITNPGDNPFPIITGVSVGSINATALASKAEDFRAGAAWLNRLWANMRTSDIYRTDALCVARQSLHWLFTLTLGGLVGSTPKSLLDPSPLAKLLEQEIDFERIGSAIGSGTLRALAVTASSYENSRATTFFQGHDDCADWQRARRDGVATKIGVEHVLASTALPLVFRAQAVAGEHFGDGALRLTAPLSPAIRLGARKILVIGVRDESPERREFRTTGPSAGDIVGYLMDVLFNDNLNADIERLTRINETLSLLSPEQRHSTNLREIDVYVIRPSIDVRTIAGDHAAALPPTIKMLLRGVGAWGSDWRVPSYLLFEPGYCRALLDLGYRDAMSERQALTEFLEPSRARSA